MMISKMSELSVVAPLAKLNEDWEGDFGDFQTGGSLGVTTNSGNISSSDQQNKNVSAAPPTSSAKDQSIYNSVSTNSTTRLECPAVDNAAFGDNNYLEPMDGIGSMSGSLEDLVNSFDEKISNCFQDYGEEVDKLAPVQVRSQEEIVNDCQIWWTLTGTFGNILPIDWSKTHARQLHLPTLNLNTAAADLNILRKASVSNNANDVLLDTNVDEEELAKDLDLHSLILTSLQQEPLFTAEQVLEEIDEIMQEDEGGQGAPSSRMSNGNGSNVATPMSADGSEMDSSMAISSCSTHTAEAKSVGISSLLHKENLQSLSSAQLNELYCELECMIQDHSETLIQELALRDELEFEKELKNSFISLLLGIQNKRRQHHMDKKRGRGPTDSKYLTTVIPYNPEDGPPDVRTVQILIKILKAINEDNPSVPTLLTDYILRVLVPTK